MKLHPRSSKLLILAIAAVAAAAVLNAWPARHVEASRIIENRRSPFKPAITEPKRVDTKNKYANVGTFIVIRGPNPIGLPPGIAGMASCVLINERVILSAGHFVARMYNNGNGIPPFSRVVVSFSPNALDQSTWIDINRSASAHVPHPSFPLPCSPQFCPFDDTDGLAEPGVADIGLSFLDSPIQGVTPATLAMNPDSGDSAWPGERLKQVGYGLTEAPPAGTIIFDGLFDGIRRIGMSSNTVIDENWLSYNRDPSGTCHGDSGAPTFFDGQVVDVASDGNDDCATGDVRARVDTALVRQWIDDTIAARLGVAGDSHSLRHMKKGTALLPRRTSRHGARLFLTSRQFGQPEEKNFKSARGPESTKWIRESRPKHSIQ